MAKDFQALFPANEWNDARSQMELSKIAWLDMAIDKYYILPPQSLAAKIAESNAKTNAKTKLEAKRHRYRGIVERKSSALDAIQPSLVKCLKIKTKQVMQ